MWQLCEVMVYSWRIVIKVKESTENYITILKQTLIGWGAPARTRHSVNHLETHSEPELPAHKPRDQQGQA